MCSVRDCWSCLRYGWVSIDALLTGRAVRSTASLAVLQRAEVVVVAEASAVLERGALLRRLVEVVASVLAGARTDHLRQEAGV